MSSSHYTKNGRNVMLKTTSSQTASSPDSNASEAYRTLRDRGPYPAAQANLRVQWLVPIDLLQLKGILDSDLVPLKLRNNNWHFDCWSIWNWSRYLVLEESES
ncbi:hypothetical protein HN51_048597 [Arachis hypogaea]